MGLLSKIFNTDKLEYILREEEEFSVAAPQNWNIETLTVGDTITPDMWDQNKIKEPQLDDWFSKPIQIQWIEDYKFDDGSIEFSVGLEIKDHEDWDQDWELDYLNDLLKPEYKIVAPDNLNESDEFDVDVPEGWNVKELTIGDTIKRDWLKDKFLETNPTSMGLSGDVKIEKFGKMGGDTYVLLIFPQQGLKIWEEIDHFNTTALKPDYQIIKPGQINESQDEFTVIAPAEWDESILKVGSQLKSYMFKDNRPWLDTIKTIITKLNWSRNVMEIEEHWPDGRIKRFRKPPHYEEQFLTKDFEFEKNTKLKELLDIDNDWDVEAPKEWNKEYLQIGDIITLDMWDTIHGFGFREPVYIIDVGTDDGRDYVLLNNKPHSDGYDSTWDLDEINDNLKHPYKIASGIDLDESDKEFTVDAPKEWNIQTLYDGDLITPDMWNRENLSKVARLKNYIYDPDQDWTVIEAEDDPNFIIFKSKGGVKIMFKKDTVNSLLKPEYQLDVPINESDDEFNVKAPQKWNVKELTVGDDIEPHMWDLNNVDLYDYIDDPNENWIIDSIDERMEIQIVTLSGGETWCRVDDLNGVLKPEYKIVRSLTESEDEFNVDAPQGWNVIELTVGNTITPDMIQDQIHDKISRLKGGDRKLGFKILDIKDSDDGAMVRLQMLNSTRLPVYWNIKTINDKYLKSQYKVVPSSFDVNESEDEFNVEAPTEWNQEYLTAGDTITPDMWDVSKLATQLKYYFKKPVEISRIGYSEFDDEELELLVNIDLGEYFADFDINHVNDLLKPQYKVVQNKALTEEEDDFAVDAPTGWNYELLTIGDTITPDMWDDDVNNMSSIKEFNKVLKKPFIIKDISRSDLGGNIHYLITLDNDIHIHSSFLKPQYKVVPDLNESEDDFTVNAPKEWNVTELGVGDYLDSSNLKMQNYSKKYEIVEIVKNRWGNLVLLNVYELVEKPIPGTIRTNKQWETYRQSRIEISDLESKMKPGFKIDVSGLLNESLSKLLEVDDEWSVISPDKWNESQLTIGDQITPDMWDEKAVIDAGVDGFFLNDEIWTISNIVSRWIQLSSDKFGHLDRVDDIQALLKPQYQIVKNINENEDEFSVEAPEGWNKILLTKGDYITPDMWRKIPNRFANPPQSVEIGGFGLVGDADDIKTVRLIKSDMSHVAYSFPYDDLNNELLKPQYQIVHPIDGNNKWKDLYEENESNDEFNVDAPKDWNIDYLGIGDTITPDMWNKRETKYVTGLSFNKPLKISWIGTDGISGFIEFKGYKSDYLDVEFIHDLLKPQYRIGLSNLNESDNEFNVDAPKDWNIQYLGAGDTIKGKMWDWKEIINNVNANHRDDFDAINRDIERWKQVYDEGVTIKSIEGDKDHFWIDFDSNFLNWGPGVRFINRLLSPGYEIEKQLTEEAEDFMVTAPKKWDVIELGVGDYINSNMLNPKGNDYTWFSRRKFFIEDIYFDECWTVKLTHVESEHDEEMCVDFLNSDVLNDKYKIITSLNELSKLLEADDEFTVNAPKEWNVQELGIGDKITKDMIKNPEFLDRMDEDFEMDFPGVITKIYKTSGNENWGVRIRFQDVGWRKYLPKSKDIKLGLGFNLDSFNDNNLKPQYKIKEPVFELSTLLENEEDFNVNAPDEWNVELLTVGDTITPDMWGYDGIFFDVSKPLTIEDIGEDEGGWWIQLGRSEAPFDLDEINEYLKSKYRVVPYILEESDDDDFNVSASPEWNVTELGVGDIITPDMWDYTKDGDEFRNKIKKSFIINRIFKEDGWDSGWGVSIVHYIPEFPQTSTLGGLEYGLGELNNHLKPQYKIFIPGALNENEEDFNVSAPSEWNEEYWDDYEGEEEDIYNNFQNFVYRVLKKREVGDEFIEVYLDEIFSYGDIDDYRNISSSKLIEDFNVWIEAQDSDSDWYVDMNESDDEFNVSAPESWWEYDGDIEIMFQDTYWYEDENGKEAIVERDGGGILNINDLKQYSYSGWIPFTGNPTNENLTKWYSSIDWDTDLIEIFGFDDSIFEVEEDFDWSTAENVDMDRTGFRIRAVSTLKEVEDEFTVKAPKKWDIVYLNKGDFLDNTNSTFNDPNVKYEIGNITSDGEIEVKKYINRGNGFEPQFDRFMKTRKGIVKAKLKSGFDIETSSK